MKRAIVSLLCIGLAAALAPACNGGFPTIGPGKKLVVTLTSTDTGTVAVPLPVSVNQPTSFTVNVEAQLPDGTTDTSFNGYVNITSQPGTILDLTVRNVQLQNGKLPSVNGAAPGLVLPVVGAFGETHIWADDLGYEPAAPNRQPPPQCSNGIDDNNNGLIDYPADPGCYAPVDDSESLGTYAAGVSGPIYFELPRVSLVRGYDPKNNGNGNATAFPQQQISIDTGWRGDTNYKFSTVVIGLTAAGFYVQDLQNASTDVPTGYGGLYAYNFSTPAFMRVCDRVQILSGTSSDFYGFTELNYPTWQLEYWNPAARPCLVPAPTTLYTPDLTSNQRLWQTEATLVRVQSAGTVQVHVASHFGPGDIPLVNGVYTPDATHSNCDFDHSGKINYADPAESACAAVCTGSCSLGPTDFQCSEWSQFESQNAFELIVTDPSNQISQARATADAAAANGFNATTLRGQKIGAFSGLLSYFSGGCQFTISARCADDIVTDPNGTPLPSDQACVHPRTLSDINANSQ